MKGKARGKRKEVLRKSLRSVKKPGDRRGKNPNSLKNLKPYPKGVSGNISGRPKMLGEAFKARLAVVLNDGRTVAEAIAESTCDAAEQGDMGAVRTILSATEDTGQMKFESGGGEVVFRIVRDDRVPDPPADAAS